MREKPHILCKPAIEKWLLQPFLQREAGAVLHEWRGADPEAFETGQAVHIRTGALVRNKV